MKTINKKCEKCGKELINVYRNTKYCDKCRKIIKNEASKICFDKKQKIKSEKLKEEYKKYFFEITKENGYVLTTKGFTEVSKYNQKSYRRVFNDMNWVEILKMFNKYELALDYVKNEYIKYYKDTNCQDLHIFGINHPYITYEFILNLGKDKIMEECNIRKLRNKDEDYKINFDNIKREIGGIPSYTEFLNFTKITISNYVKRFNIKGKKYDNIVKMYSTEEEYNDYIKRKIEFKKENMNKNGLNDVRFTSEDLEKEFKTVFDNYYKDFKEYPSRKIFNKISKHDDSIYRKRLNINSWIDICKNYGYIIPSKFKFENSVLNALDYILKEESKRQKTFKWLRSKKNGFLRLDGYYENYNLAIETDGQQHFQPIKKFGGEKHFNEIIENDNLKDKLVKEHGLIMLRIKINEPWYYKDFLIEKLKKVGISIPRYNNTNIKEVS